MTQSSSTQIFEKMESEVRGYCRSFPVVFNQAQDSTLTDEQGRQYIDFFSGAGTMNYGHNNPQIKKQVIDYLQSDGLIHGLDMYSSAKRNFLERFQKIILEPRNLHYKVQFPGPTGTNAVETAIKLARKVTGRENVISFTNAYHGMTMGSLALTGNQFYRQAAGVGTPQTNFLPYAGYLEDLDTIEYMEKVLLDKSSGVDIPAAIIVETVQGEGGINVASYEWLAKLSKLAKRFDILLIVDDIQVGNGRTGYFFSFEPSGIQPDMVLLSKSISGYGLPMALVLFKPELDQWDPGEHTGTFRGNNLAFVSAAEALSYWENDQFSHQIQHKGQIMQKRLEQIARRYSNLDFKVRGRGMIWGVELPSDLTSKIVEKTFEKGLIMETSGAEGQVAKFLPALTIDEKQLNQGLDIFESCVEEVLNNVLLANQSQKVEAKR